MDRKDDKQRVIVTDIHMSFWSMVVFIVKWTLASIPALVILVFIAAVCWSLATSFLSGKRESAWSPSRVARKVDRSPADSPAPPVESPTAPGESSVPPAGKWQVSESKNPIDDSETVMVALSANSGTSGRLNQPVSLVIRCQSNQTELYIKWQEYLGTEARVLTRIGTAEATTARWPLSTDSKGTFYPGSPIPFVRQLLLADVLVARVTPYNENPVTAIFDLSGLSEAVVPLQTACNWK